MNPRARRFNARRCAICDYAFADEHHIYPEAWGGIQTIPLCPNHHRMAGMAQVMLNHCLYMGWDYRPIENFANNHFDAAFRSILDQLILCYELEEARIADSLFQDMEPWKPPTPPWVMENL